MVHFSNIYYKTFELCDDVQSYTFCDASKKAVLAVPYIDVPDETRSEVSFMISK